MRLPFNIIPSTSDSIICSGALFDVLSGEANSTMQFNVVRHLFASKKCQFSPADPICALYNSRSPRSTKL